MKAKTASMTLSKLNDIMNHFICLAFVKPDRAIERERLRFKRIF